VPCFGIYILKKLSIVKFSFILSVFVEKVGEVGELCECFQWRGEVEEGLNGMKVKTKCFLFLSSLSDFFNLDWLPEEKEHLEQELSDVLLYLIRLADKCAVGPSFFDTNFVSISTNCHDIMTPLMFRSSCCSYEENCPE
jgi:NTP pyrophosphatase (non-canonical NTP hydrolase)